MMEQEIEFLEAMQVLTLQPNDILVLRSNTKISTGAQEMIKRYIRDNLKLENRVILMEDGMEIAVLRQEKRGE